MSGLLTVAAHGAGARTPPSTPIAGSALPAADRAEVSGPVVASAGVDYEVVLGPRDPVGAQALALAVSTPGSASYRRFLTPRQWEQRFSPSRDQVAVVTDWLRHQGLRVQSVSTDRLAIDVTSSAGQLDQAFDTTLGYATVDGQRSMVSEGDLSVPASLSGLVTGVVGVNDVPATPMNGHPRHHRPLRHPRPPRRRRSSSSATRPSSTAAAATVITPPPAMPAATPCESFYGQTFDKSDPPYGHGYPDPLPYAVCGYTPAQLRQSYGVAGDVAAGDTGAGTTVAIVDAYASPTLLSDAQTYAARNDPGHPLLPSQFSEMASSGSQDVNGCQADNWYAEGDLDVEAVHAMAPGARIVYVGAKNCHRALYDRLRYVVDHHLADVVSASWGDDAGDKLDPPGLRAAVDDILEMAAGTGVSVVVASGDNGDEFSTTGMVAADYPASSPWVTAVGGTTFEISFGIGEAGWSTGTSQLCTLPAAEGCTAGSWLAPQYNEGSGGGTSDDYHQPTYQAGVVPAALADRNGPVPMRVEPDVAMDADPDTGFLEGVTETFAGGVHYGQLRAGGTSLSTPLFAGEVLLADQLAGGSLGFLNPTLYGLDRSQPLSFVDVGPRPSQAVSNLSYVNALDPSLGVGDVTDIIDYQGTETYCPSPGRSGGRGRPTSCSSRTVALATAPGYDDMTGLGAPAPGFVAALAHAGKPS